MERDKLTADLAARLVTAQFPQWADLPVVPVSLSGWDNATFRLGDELSVRLPSHSMYAAQVAKEHHWLPLLAPQLPLPVPEPVALGRPAEEFPRPWSIYRWLAGETAATAPIADPVVFATSLARFLAALQSASTGGGPAAGDHSFGQGGPLAAFDDQTRQLIDAAGTDIEACPALDVWDAACSSIGAGPPVWVHGDTAPSNLLVTAGALSAVIDFGGLAVGDPACDLVMAWTYFEGASAAAFRNDLALDDATWARGRGWALWKALASLAEERAGHGDPRRRFGWLRTPLEVVSLVIADHAGSAR